jgi:ABC-type phosphate/phosphonate transport system substrate-binding protein
MQPLINDLATEIDTNIRWETASQHEILIDRIKNNRYDMLFVDTPTTLLSYYQANYRPIVRIPGVISASFVSFVDQEALILSDLKGKRIGFLRPSMLATKLAKRHLKKNGIVAKEFFGETLYLANHNSALNALRVGRVDAIVIASAVYGAHDGEYDGRGLIIIEQTRTVPQYAFSVNRNLSATTRNRLKRLLLAAHQSPVAADFFKLRVVEQIIPADISVYQPYRRMLQYITD